MNELHWLNEQFHEIQPKADSFLDTYLSSVKTRAVRNVISKGALYNLRPFEIQRSGFKLGKELKALPKNIKNTHIYYFDIEERVILTEIYGQSGKIKNRAFYFYEANEFKSICFNSGGSIRNIMLSSLDTGRIVQEINFGKYGESSYNYLYENNRLTSITIKQKEHDQDDYSSHQVLFKYLDGEMIKITNVFPNGYQEQRYP
ncbi:hypothetical protein [Pseudomonas purpurea]|uniref:hypothetical protein n=1 Tax=Pseudomonas purpurea TaxID=3136737 RepID=UPI0032647641